MMKQLAVVGVVFFVSYSLLISSLLGLERSGYTSLDNRVASPDLILEQPAQTFKERRATLWSAISANEVQRVESSLAKDFEWVNSLYLRQNFSNNQITKSAYDQLQQKLLLTREHFNEIDTIISKQEAQQEWFRRLSASWNIRIPEFAAFPSLVLLQFAFQLEHYFYCRSNRSREPIKQLIAQKKLDLAQVETDFAALQIVDDADFKET